MIERALASLSSLPEAKKADTYHAQAALMGYIEALEGMPVDVLEYACQLFRNGDAGKGFFPSSADLRQECVRIMRLKSSIKPVARSSGENHKSPLLEQDPRQQPLKCGLSRADFVAMMYEKYNVNDTPHIEGGLTPEEFEAKHGAGSLDRLPDNDIPNSWNRLR